MSISELLQQHHCSIQTKIKDYADAGAETRTLIDLDQSVQSIRTDHGLWSCSVDVTPVGAHPVTLDVTLSLTLVEGDAASHGLSVEVATEDWSEDHYLLLPGAVYNGNRFHAIPLPYPPMLTSEDDLHIDGPITITDVPRLSNHRGEPSSIELLSGDLSTPAIGFHSPITKTGCWIMTTQETAAGQTGLSVHENADRSRATFALSYPGMREGHVYRICDREGAPSPDRAADFKQGQTLSVSFRISFFPCPSVQDLFDLFITIRKQLTGEPEVVNSIPFSAAWRIQEDAFNQSWNSSGEYYPSFDPEVLEHQIGWVGGTCATYALLTEGNETSRNRALRSTDRLLTKGQAPTGFLYSSGKDGTLVSDGIWDPFPHNLFSIRKNADALYFLVKQCLLLAAQGEYEPRVEAWKGPLARLASAFVRLWEANGQLGQLADIETGELRVGGSTAGAIGPAGLALTSVLLGDARYREVAEAVAHHYYERDVQRGVTTGGPLEILQCPDSESAYALLESFVLLYEVTGRRQWLDRACAIAHQCATWNVSYDFRWPAGTEFGRLGLRTAGSVIANVQNKHSAPGICTLSGDSLFRLFRYTGNMLYLDLIRETAHNLPQYLSREDRPIFSWDADPVPLPAGTMSERVNMSDWEGQAHIGGVFLGSSWAGISNMLTFSEIPGVYVQPDTGLVVAIDHVEAVTVGSSPLLVRVTNTTPYDAEVKLLVEDSTAASTTSGIGAPFPFRRVRLQPGEAQVLTCS